MRSRLFVCGVPLVVALASCGPSTPTPTPTEDAAADVTPDVAAPPDVAPDTTAPPDAAADVTSRPDVVSDVSADASRPDATVDVPADAPRPDAATDAPAPDVTAPPDVANDVANDTPVDASGMPCGTRGTGPCPAGMFCNHPLSAMCGVFDAPGACAPVPTACTRELFPVCGCDGTTYSNACLAAAASVSVRATGACPAADAGADAAQDAPPAMCAAQDAAGSGACAAFFGYAWNGSTCVGISGCSCVGTACRALFSSPEACRAAYPSCDCRTTGCPAGRRCDPCRGVGGVVYACIPDGAAC